MTPPLHHGWGFFVSTNICLPSLPKFIPQDQNRTGPYNCPLTKPVKTCIPDHNPKNYSFYVQKVHASLTSIQERPRMTYPRVRKRTEGKAKLLLLEAGGAGSNPVIPTSIYKERPSRGRSFILPSCPRPLQTAHLSDNLRSQEFSVSVLRGRVLAPGQIDSRPQKNC